MDDLCVIIDVSKLRKERFRTMIKANVIKAVEKMEATGRYYIVRNSKEFTIGLNTPSGRKSTRCCGWEIYNDLKKMMVDTPYDFGDSMILVYGNQIKIKSI